MMQKTDRIAVITEWNFQYTGMDGYEETTIKRRIYSDGYQDWVKVNGGFIELEYYRLSRWHSVYELKGRMH